ncbi:MAG: BatD family protein [Isosphaeraceae bacterium]
MRHSHPVMIGLAVVTLLVLAGRASADDEPEVAVEADASEIFIGESVDYIVEIRNVKNPPTPDLSAHRQDFDVVATGNESRNQSSTFIINGRVTQQNSFGHAYRFRLTPKRTGKLVIPAPSATIDGKTVSGRPLDLTVIAPEAQDVVILEIKTSREKVYPTQPFEVTLRVLVRPLPDDPDRDPVMPLRRRPPHIEVNWVDLPAGLTGEDKARWLEKLLAEDGSGFTLNDVTTRGGAFSFFDGPKAAVFNLYQGRESRKGLDGKTIHYFVYELKRKLIAEKAGTYSLGPAIVKGSFVDALKGSNYTARRLVAVAPAVSLAVREVPSPRPATFCGGIGDYRLAASASPTSLRVGDPLTLTLDFERGPSSGSLDLVSAPDLSANTQVAADFEVLDKSPTGRKQGEAKRFEYALRPKRAGVGIPALAVAVFNPDKETFSELATQPIALTVSAASRLDAADLVGSVAGSGTQEIKSREQGIFQNVTDPSELKDERVDVVALAGVTAVLWCGAGCLIAFVSVHRRKLGDVAWQRQRHARRTAERKVAEARKVLAEGRSMDAMRAIRSALVGLIADMRNILAEGLTASEADATLARTAVPDVDRAEVMRLLEAIESAEYGSGIASEAPAMIETAERLVPSLARHLERGA